MLICRYEYEGATAYGVMAGDTVSRLEGDPFGEYRAGGYVAPLGDLKLLAPSQPSKIIGVGPGYRGVADQFLYENPRIFLKPSGAARGPDDDIVVPAGMEAIAFDGELAVVIGRRARNVSRDDALHYVLGYVLGNDVTAPEAMAAEDGQIGRAKAYDTFFPYGPVINTDLDPTQALVNVRKNGVYVGSSKVAELVYDVPTQVAYISSVMTLEPGDVITTGCAAAAHGPMRPGDVIEVEADGLGLLRNRVVGA